MGKKKDARLEAEATLFDTIDFEGGFYEAFLGYGVDIKNYAIDKDTATEIRDIVIGLKKVDKRVKLIMEDLEKSSIKYHEQQEDE